MTALKTLQDRGQNIWLDSISREMLESVRWRRLAEAGAQPQRLLWASTGTKDPALPAGYYLTALAAKLQADGRDSFVQSWNDLLACIESKRKIMRAA